MRDHFKAAFGVVAIFLLQWAAQMMWPEADPNLLLSLAGLATLAWLAIHYWSRVTSLLRKKTKHYSGAASPAHFHFSAREASGTTTPPSLWKRFKRRTLRNIGMGLPRTVSVSGIAEIERCHQELVKYIRSQPPDPINFEHIALTQEFLPHIERAHQILDEQEIPHPEIDADLVFDGMREWGTFLARVLAVKHDVVKARLVYGEMQSRPDSGVKLHE